MLMMLLCRFFGEDIFLRSICTELDPLITKYHKNRSVIRFDTSHLLFVGFLDFMLHASYDISYLSTIIFILL